MALMRTQRQIKMVVIVSASIGSALFIAPGFGQDLSLKVETVPPPPPAPPVSYDEAARLREAAGMATNRSAGTSQGRTPKWTVAYELRAVFDKWRKSSMSAGAGRTRYVERATTKLGPPDWVVMECGPHPEAHCEWADRYKRFASRKWTMVWYNGPCVPIEIHFSKDTRTGEFRPWAYPGTAWTRCTNDQSAMADTSYPIDHYRCAQTPTRPGCQSFNLAGDEVK